MSRERITGDGRRAARPFTLWREVLVAYLAPALMAGAGGVASGQAELTMAAVTSIAGTSAVVALLSGTWLQRRKGPHLWTVALPRVVLVALLALGSAMIAGLVGWFASRWLPAHTGVPDAPWLTRLGLDLPISAALAASIVSWRWRGARRSQPRQP
ncbi:MULTISPECIES: hypothetical protein [Streptomyces]|uniref:hypothetical protein n=1 Tax=Streptomyces TaxID=1883 RepID=UPI0002419DE7|nr:MULTISPECIES: hypothetical protein [Streptomyces]EHM30918.1 hypothetical protein SPW_0694 [Streptomyces sp. W007]MCX4506741.1 hypothetical protein [Streptomyces anulatus]MCX4523648.1 hypothetical protein [Streptomyces anulatus]MCX4523777.1 hypothetical protein [Streptomyces anulatus]MCX4606713.1 hypothetical protein [Streptomyces anulatus]